jgi:hypothetical protein
MRHYEMIAANYSYFCDFDPFGGAKYNSKIADLLARHCKRTYGTTNIQRWTHGWLLPRMVAQAMARIKFV